MGETPSLIPFDRLPLGFRFHPTHEELINHYLKRKIDGQIKAAEAAVIPEIDVCKVEPWDLPERSPIRSGDPEWFFFAAVDRKYPSGNRSNRATVAGYWKATGKDRMIQSRARGGAQVVVGMKKTLVFHQGRAPKGVRTNWIMHEYRTVEPEFECGDQGGFVLCRLFRKPEETVSGLISYEPAQSGFSHTQTGSSPVSTPCRADCLEVESFAPLNKTSPESDLHEELQSLPETIGKQSADNKLADEAHNLTYPVKPEESHCNSNMTSDAGDNNAEGAMQEEASLYDDLPEFLGPEYGHLLSEEYPNLLMLPGADYPTSYDVDQGSHAQIHCPEFKHDQVTAMLYAMLSTPEECSAGVSSYQINSITNVSQGQVSTINQGSHWYSAMERNVVYNVDAEPLLAKKNIGQEDSASSRLPFSSTDNLQMGTSEGCKVYFQGLQIRELETVERVRHANSDENSTSPPISMGTKINIRRRNHENFISSVTEPSNFLGHQGMAGRRIRLQSSEHVNDWHIRMVRWEADEDDDNRCVEETEESELSVVGDDDLSPSDTDGTSSSNLSLSEFYIESHSGGPQMCSVGHDNPTLRLRSRQINDADINQPESSSLHQEVHKVVSFSTRRIGAAVLVLASLICAATLWFSKH